MRRRDILRMVLVAPAGFLGMFRAKTARADSGGCGKAKPGTCALCHKCGQIKGSDKCCKEDAEKCPKCGLHKGSPGCCRLKGAKEDVTLCAYCGEIKGSKKCCKEGVPECENCGLHKGSPGCCRIKKEKMPAK